MQDMTDLLGTLVALSPFSDVHEDDRPQLDQQEYDRVLRMLAGGGVSFRVSDDIDTLIELEAEPGWGFDLENNVILLTLMGVAASTRIPRLVQALAAFGGNPYSCGESTDTDGDMTCLDIKDVWDM